MAKKKTYRCSTTATPRLTHRELESIAGEKLTAKEADWLSAYIANEVDLRYNEFFAAAASDAVSIWYDAGKPTEDRYESFDFHNPDDL